MRDQRVSFVIRASRGESVSSLCREFGISRPTGYVWLKRFAAGGVAGVEEQSRRPLASPGQTPSVIEARVAELRRARPDWGARKLRVLLGREGMVLPAGTVHRILVRRGLVKQERRLHPAPSRFVRSRPNELWQMDFKGQKGSPAITGPLSVVDDHSRYLLTLTQTGTTAQAPVKACLEEAFQAFGLPDAMLMDHGVPWWNASQAQGWTQLSIWLMRQGIRCLFSGIRHPQTQGKVERFHGALERARARPDGHCWLDQAWLSAFREEYNQLRPHEALAMQTPASLYRPSERPFEPNPPEWNYGPQAELRKVNCHGDITIHDRPWRVSLALRTQRVQIQRVDQRVLVYFCNTLVREIDLAAQRSTRVDR